MKVDLFMADALYVDLIVTFLCGSDHPHFVGCYCILGIGLSVILLTPNLDR